MTRPAWPGGPGQHHGARGGRCLGADLTPYADRTLDPAALLRWDRHLVSCEACRHAVAQERRVLAALRAPSAPGVPGDLRGMLLALGCPTGDRDAPPHELRPGVPPVPVAPVPVVNRGAPALHRSARRSTVLAGLAAGATAAAAVSLVVSGGAVTGSPVTTGTTGATPGTVQRARPATGAPVTAVFTVPTARFMRAGVAVQPTSAPATGTVRPSSAQLTP